MSTNPEANPWQGRVDDDGEGSRRWHQCVQALPETGALQGRTVLIGFACDEGVRRNRGRPGSRDGPRSIRVALANQAFAGTAPVYDAGDVRCEDGNLEQAQAQLAQRLSRILGRGGAPVLLGGGHEIAWGTYQGLRSYLGNDAGALGIINMDAHFDLRNPLAGGSSGTPFRQIAEWCERHDSEFRYLVLGINPAANTEALFDYARAQGVQWVEDWACTEARLPALQDTVNEFVAPLDALYLTLCLDVFAAALAPGVSAPGVPGISATTGIALLHHIRTACAAHGTRLVLMDIAEMNPHFDRDGITARWAARLIREYLA